MSFKTVGLTVVALCVGAALGYVIPKSSVPIVPAEEEDGYLPKGVIENLGAEATINALRERIKSLELALDVQMQAAAIEEKPREERVRGNRRERGERGNFNPREMMENLKKEDPERYAQMTNNFERWRVRREAERTNRLDFLKSIDTSTMSAGTRSTHQKLLANTDKIAEVEALLRDENTTDEERRELFGQIRELHETQRQLNEQERENLIEQISIEVGMSAEDAAEFGATINEILQATEATGGRGPGGPGGPRGGMMGPPPMR